MDLETWNMGRSPVKTSQITWKLTFSWPSSSIWPGGPALVTDYDISPSNFSHFPFQMCLSSFCSLIVMDSTLTQRVISRDSNLHLKMMLFKIWLYCQYWLEEVIHIYITYIISVLGYLCSVRKVTQIWRFSMQPCLTLRLYWLEEVINGVRSLSFHQTFLCPVGAVLQFLQWMC